MVSLGDIPYCYTPSRRSGGVAGGNVTTGSGVTFASSRVVVASSGSIVIAMGSNIIKKMFK